MPLTTLTRIKIDKLKDVDTVSTSPSNGQALVWSVAQQNWIPGNVASGGGGGGTLVFDTFTGDGVETTFTLSEPQPTEETAILVYIDGVVQPPLTAYTLSGGDIVFADAPPDATSINVLQLPGGGGGSITVKDEGSTLTSAASIVNFVGSGVTATNLGSTVTVTIPGGGGTGTANFEDILIYTNP